MLTYRHFPVCFFPVRRGLVWHDEPLWAQRSPAGCWYARVRDLRRLPAARLTSELHMSFLAGMQCDRRMVELLSERFASGAMHMPFHSFVSCVTRLRRLFGIMQTSVRLNTQTRFFWSRIIKRKSMPTWWTQEPLQRLCTESFSHLCPAALYESETSQEVKDRGINSVSTCWHALSVPSLLKVFDFFLLFLHPSSGCISSSQCEDAEEGKFCAAFCCWKCKLSVSVCAFVIVFVCCLVYNNLMLYGCKVSFMNSYILSYLE